MLVAAGRWELYGPVIGTVGPVWPWFAPVALSGRLSPFGGGGCSLPCGCEAVSLVSTRCSAPSCRLRARVHEETAKMTAQSWWRLVVGSKEGGGASMRP